MAFKLKQKNTFTWPVKVNIPVDGGTYEAGTFDAGLQCLQLFQRPDFADGHIINSRDDAIHARNLADVFKGDGVGLAVPAECHFHDKVSFN